MRERISKEQRTFFAEGASNLQFMVKVVDLELRAVAVQK